MSEPLSDYEDCGCGKCCLPTIVAERDEAMARALAAEEAEKVREQAFWAVVAAKEQAHARADSALRARDDANAEREAAKQEAMRCQDDNERLRISLSVAVGLLNEIQNWRHIRGTTMELPVQKFLAEMRGARWI